MTETREQVKSEVEELKIPGRKHPLLIARFLCNDDFDETYEELWQKVQAQVSMDVRVLIYYDPDLKQSGSDQNTIYTYSQKFIPLVSKSAVVGIYGIKSREAKLKLATMVTGRVIVSHKNEEEAIDWLASPITDKERSKIQAGRERDAKKGTSKNYLGRSKQHA